MKPALAIQQSHIFRSRSIERYPFKEGLWCSILESLGCGSRRWRQRSKPRIRPGTPAMKKAERHPYLAATCVVSTGAMASPTRAAALTTMPTFLPRDSGVEDASTVAVIVDQVGPSATPINERMTKSCAKDRAMPESQDKIENINTAGINTGRLPTRSESAPKIKEDTAQGRASDDTSKPTCPRGGGRAGAMH